MAIYGTGYRRLDYRPTAMGVRLWPLVWEEFRVLFRKRLGVLAFLGCLVPTFMQLVALLLQVGVLELGFAPDGMRGALRDPGSQMGERFARFNARSIEFYLSPILPESFSYTVFLLLTSLVSCRAIAKDRETNALELYWTRAIEPRGYFAAKWLGSFLLVGSIFVAAPMLLWGLGALLSSDPDFLATTWPFIPEVFAALLLFTAVLTYAAIAFSAVATTANMASILWLSLLIGTTAIGEVLARVFQGEWWYRAINPWGAMQRIAQWICGVDPRRDYDPRIALLLAGALIAGLTLWMLKRMRRVEAVS